MANRRFRSTARGLVLQDSVKPEEGTGVWAEFRDGYFETDDEEVAARLAAVDGVEEIKGKDAADQGVDPDTVDRSPDGEPVPGAEAPVPNAATQDEMTAGLEVSPAGGIFDPAGHTEDEVKLYLEGNITDAERDRVLEAERSGRNRPALVGDSEPDPDNAIRDDQVGDTGSGTPAPRKTQGRKAGTTGRN